MIQSKFLSRLFLAILFFTVPISISFAQHKNQNFPGEHWNYVRNIDSCGFSVKALKKAKKYSETINTAAVIIIHNGQILKEWGEVDKKFMTHSIRKSFLSALYGNYVATGVIDLDKTLADIEIDDIPALTDKEKKVTIRDCIKARSGIYHDALYETKGMKKLKPVGLDVLPGTFWYYNNWDFNAAGTIFEKLTGTKIFQAIKTDISDKIDMEGYAPEDGWYEEGEPSIHPAYPFKISARDMARFGLLMLRKGKWKTEQVIPEDWVEESTRYHSDATLYKSSGYGYMWWVERKFNKYSLFPGLELPEGSYCANGAGGHYILVIPEYDMVIVHRVDTFIDGNRISKKEFGKLVQLILESRS